MADEVKELNADSILDELNKEPEEVTEKEDILAKPVVEEEKEEEEPVIEDEDEPKEEDLELSVPVSRKEILKKYPNIFKDFPALQTAYYRDREYTDLFATIDDAKEILERSQQFDGFQQSLLSGDINSVLGAVKSTDEKAFAKLVDNYLPALYKADIGAHNHVVGNIFKQTIQMMAEEAKRSNVEQLNEAAQILHQWIFGNSSFQAPTTFSKNSGNNEEQQKLEEERRNFTNERLTAAVNDLQGKVDNSLKSTIDTHIDPRGVMTSYVKKNAIREVIENLQESIQSDNRFVTMKDQLWNQAKKENFSKSSLDKIRSAYLSKAKVLLPQLILKVRNDALKGMRATNGEERDKKGPLPVGRTASVKSVSSKEIPKGMTTLEFLNME